MADDTAPSSVRLPDAVIPFVADTSAIERSIDALTARIQKDFPESFGRAVEGMTGKLETLETRLAELARPLTESLDAAALKADTIASTTDQGRARVGAAGLEDRKLDQGISIAEAIQRFGSFKERSTVEDFIGPNAMLAAALRENTEILREIRDSLVRQEGEA